MISESERLKKVLPDTIVKLLGEHSKPVGSLEKSSGEASSELERHDDGRSWGIRRQVDGIRQTYKSNT